MAAPTGPGGGGGTGGSGSDPRAAEALAAALRASVASSNELTTSYDRQLKMILQMRDAMNQVAQQMSALCKQDCAGMSPETWQAATRAAQNHNNELSRSTTVARTAQTAIGKLADVTSSKLTKSLIVGRTALDGLKQGFSNIVAIGKAVGGFFGTVLEGAYNITRSFLAIPMKIFKGLADMAQSGGNGHELAEAYEAVREQFGSLKSEASSTVINVAKGMGTLDSTGVSAFRIFGNLAQRIQEVNKLATAMGNSFTAFQGEIARNGEAIMRLQRGLGITDEQMGTIAQSAMRMGKSITELQVDMTKQSQAMSKAFGVNAKLLSRDMTKALQDVAHFGSLSTKELAIAGTYAQKLGVSIDKLTASMDATKTFDSTIDAVSKLNEQFGTNIDATELMMEENPAKQQEMLRKALLGTGKDMSKLDRFQREMIKSTGLMTDEMIDASFSAKNAGVSLNQISKVADKTENSTMSQTQALTALADSIKRLTPQGDIPKANSMIDALMQGFNRGVITSVEFQKVLRNIAAAFRIMNKLGFDLGRMFVQVFPGVKDMLGGLADMFNPASYQKMAAAVLKTFKDFSSGSIKSFDELMEKLKHVFFDFFKADAEGGKKFLSGLQKFGEAAIKIASAAFTWMTDQLASAMRTMIDFIKNPSLAGVNAPNTSGFAKMFQPALKALAHYFETMTPLFLELFAVLGQKIFDLITSEKFLSGIKKAAPALALAFFGPVLAKSLVGVLSASLLSAAGSAIKSAFTGPGSRAISEMSGREFSRLIQSATPPPAPGGVGRAAGSVIPPGVPGPGETARAQATGSIIDSGTIIKLLLALAAIITIGLVTFYAASVMVKKMDRKQIENALIVLGGTSVAMIPAAFALSLLSKIPVGGLAGAVPVLIALGLVIPGMAYLGVLVAERAKTVSKEDVIKALALVVGMSIALIPAALALSLMAPVGATLTSTAPLILLGLAAMALVMPGLAYLGIELAKRVSEVSKEDVVKALLIIVGMSAAMLAASASLLALAGVGSLSAAVPVVLLGVAAVGLVGYAMLDLAPELASRGSKFDVNGLLKVLGVLGMMALAIIEVSVSIILLAAVGSLAALAPLVVLGLMGFKLISIPMLEFAPELAALASKINLKNVTKSLAALGLMAVAIVETVAAMALLAVAGELALAAPVILLGLGAFILVSIAMLKFAPKLGELGAGIKIDPITNSLKVLGLMSVSIAAALVDLLLLTAIGALMALAPVIVLGLGGYALITVAMLKVADQLSKVKTKPGEVADALGVIGLMTVSILQSVLNMLLLGVIGALSVVAPVIKKGLELFGEVTMGLLGLALVMQTFSSQISASETIRALGILGLMAGAIALAIVNVLLLSGLGLLIVLWPAVRLGMKHFEWITELLANKMPGIKKHIDSIAETGLNTAEGPLKTLENVSRALSAVGRMIAPLTALAILEKQGLDVTKALDNLQRLVKDMSDRAIEILKELGRMNFGAEMNDKIKSLGDTLSAIGSIAGAISGGMGKIDFGFFTLGSTRVKMLEEFNKSIAQMGTQINAILITVKDMMSTVTANKDAVAGSQAVGQVLAGIGPMVAAMTPPTGLFDALKEIKNTEKNPNAKTEFIDSALGSIKKLVDAVGAGVSGIITTVSVSLIPALALLKDISIEKIAAIGTAIGDIAKLTAALTPPPALIEAVSKAGDPEAAADILRAAKLYVEGAAAGVGTILTSLKDHLPKLVQGIAGIKELDSEAIVKLKAVGPLLGALGTLVGAIVGPAAAFVSNAPTSRRWGEDTGKSLKDLDGALLAVEDSFKDLVKEGGSIDKIIVLVKKLTPEQAESASKLAPLITAVAGIATALQPKPEILKALAEAKDEEKINAILDGIKTVARAAGPALSDMMGSVSGLLVAVGAIQVTPEQIAILDKLAPILTAVIKMTADIVASMFKGEATKFPSGADVAAIGAMFVVIGTAVKGLLETMSQHMDEILNKIYYFVGTMRGAKVSPDEMKSAAETMKSVIEIMSTMGDLVIKVQKELPPPPSPDAAAKVDPDGWAKSLASIGQLVDVVFGKRSLLSRLLGGKSFVDTILEALTDPRIATLGANKDGIAALKDAFEFIGKMPEIITGFRGLGGEGSKNINPEALAADIGKIAAVIYLTFQQTNFTDMIKILSDPNGVAKKLGTGGGEAIKSLAAGMQSIKELAAAIIGLQEDPAIAKLAAGGALSKLTGGFLGGGIGAAFGAISSTLKEIVPHIQSSMDPLTKMSGIGAKVQTSLAAITAFSTNIQSIGEVSKSIDSNVGATVKSIGSAIANLRTLETALSAADLGTFQAKMVQTAKGLGYAGEKSYKVDGKEIVINVKFEVQMNAGAVEKAIIYRSDSIIRDRINFALGSGTGQDTKVDASISTAGGAGLIAPSVP